MKRRKPVDKLETVVSVVFWVVIIALAITMLLSFCKAIKAKEAKVTKQEIPVIVPMAVTMTVEMKPVLTSLPVCGEYMKPIIAEPVAEVIEVDDPAPVEVVEPVEAAPSYTEEDLDALALVIYQEAGADAYSDETRLMVGTVALNRVADDRYPDTLQEVLMERSQYGRLHWTGLVWPERASLPGEAHAVERAYNLAEALLSGSVTDVLPADVVFQAEFIQGTEVVAEVPGIYFCR